MCLIQIRPWRQSSQVRAENLSCPPPPPHPERQRRAPTQLKSPTQLNFKVFQLKSGGGQGPRGGGCKNCIFLGTPKKLNFFENLKKLLEIFDFFASEKVLETENSSIFFMPQPHPGPRYTTRAAALFCWSVKLELRWRLQQES